MLLPVLVKEVELLGQGETATGGRLTQFAPPLQAGGFFGQRAKETPLPAPLGEGGGDRGLPRTVDALDGDEQSAWNRSSHE
nr:hypothetical protein [Verrucomicrobium spinosum]